jgi:hypothetical protein
MEIDGGDEREGKVEQDGEKVVDSVMSLIF